MDIFFAGDLKFLVRYSEVLCAVANSYVRPRFPFTSLGTFNFDSLAYIVL